MKFQTGIITSLTFAIAVILNLYSKPGMAFTITQNNNGSDLFYNFLQGDTTGLSNFKVKLTGDGRAFGVFQDDPFGLQSGVVISTGRVIDLVGQNTVDGGFTPSTASDLSNDFGYPGANYDSISMQIDFEADDTVENLYFQYVFGSEEFLEYGGSQFNDSFTLKLNGFSLARLSNGATVTINNLVPSPLGSYHPDFIYNPVGTGPASGQTKLDGYTKPLTFVGELQEGENTLIVNVQDLRDGLFDSAVFIKGGTLGTVRPPDITTDGSGSGSPGSSGGGATTRVPEPSSGLGILAIGIYCLGRILKKHQKKGEEKY